MLGLLACATTPELRLWRCALARGGQRLASVIFFSPCPPRCAFETESLYAALSVLGLTCATVSLVLGLKTNAIILSALNFEVLSD